MPKATDTKKKSSSRAAMSPEAYENHLINMAYKAVEKRIESGEATAAELVHFLRQGSIREQLELEKLKKENELLKSSRAKDAWITVQIDTASLSKEEIRGISLMLLFKNLTTTELMDVDNSNNPKMFVTEVLDFLREHPEYTQSQDEIDSKGIISDFLDD